MPVLFMLPNPYQDYDEIRKRANDFVKNSIAVAPVPNLVAETVLKIIKAKNPGFSYATIW